jgi:RHS repeat-associated protein
LTLASHCTSYNGLSNSSCGLPQVLVETTSGEITLYAYGLSRLGQIKGSDAEWFLGDALGSVRQLVDDDGDVVLARDYTPFGQPLTESGTGSSGYAFTGEQYDLYVKYVYLRARWYSPLDGRFVSVDPWPGSIRQPRTLHKYLYVTNDPVNLADPSGFQPEDRSDPYDPGWCDDWAFPRKISCRIITGRRTPDWLRYREMYGIYSEIMLGLILVGDFEQAPNFWAHYLVGRSRLGAGDSVHLEGDYWGNWARTHPYHEAMRERQLDDFFQEKVWPAAQTCQTSVGPWPARRGSANFADAKGGKYVFVEAGFVRNDVTVAIGRHYIEGDFYAEAIETSGNSVTADVTIERYIDDRFDFVDDTGDIPLGGIVGDKNFMGYGTVPNVWARTLAIQGMAHEFSVHIEWEESFPYTWKKE